MEDNDTGRRRRAEKVDCSRYGRRHRGWMVDYVESDINRATA